MTGTEVLRNFARISLPRLGPTLIILTMLGACSTTQKGSTGSGQQAAAPISEAGTPRSGTAGAGSAQQGAAGAEGSAQPQDSTRGNTAAQGGVAANEDQATVGGTIQIAPLEIEALDSPATGARDAGASSSASAGEAADSLTDEAAQLKRQLAEQAAQIDRIREEQKSAALREEADAAKQRDEALAATETATSAAKQAAAAEAARQSASREAALKARDDLAVFPPNPNAGESSFEESAVQPALERSVYFGFNDVTVPKEYDSMLMANVDYLKAHRDAKVRVEGNCDERGSREFNLALGARRAEAVKRALVLLGTDASRVSTISYGSEKPVATGNDEESYSRNRRADIVY